MNENLKVSTLLKSKTPIHYIKVLQRGINRPDTGAISSYIAPNQVNILKTISELSTGRLSVKNYCYQLVSFLL